jgi:DNA (cytosine-5)-methyltransferase 1
VKKPRLLDLFCCAGGAGMGYHRAGFDVVGVDIAPQKRYPFAFVPADALEYVAQHGHEFDAIHASPPCQAYSATASLPNVNTNNYPKLIPQMRELLQATKKPYVIENVPGAPLNNPIVLNGHHFGLRIIRCRWFETNPWLMSPGFVKPKNITTHSYRTYSSFENGATHITVAGHNFKRADGATAMGIDWMNREELAEAIPPAYTEYIGRHLMEVLA